MELTSAPSSTTDDFSRALRLVEDITCLGNLLKRQQQERDTQAERITFLENKGSTLEEELVSAKEEAASSKKKLEEITAERFQLLAELKSSHAGLEERKQRVERTDAVSHELLNQLQLKDAYIAEQKRQSDSQIYELKRQIEQLQAQSNLTEPHSHTQRIVNNQIQLPANAEPERVFGSESDAIPEVEDDRWQEGTIVLTVPEDYECRFRKTKRLGEPIRVKHDMVDPDAYPLTRAMLKVCLGGDNVSTIVTPSINSKTQLAIKHRVDTFICPKRNMNPWLPLEPGQNGFMFYGLGKDKGTYENAIVCSLFVGVQKDRVALQYYGRYYMQRTAELSLDNWNELSEEERVEYVKLTADKTKDKGRSLNTIRRLYDTGREHVPCVALKCLGFDNELYTALITVATAPPVSTLKRTGSAPLQITRAKRSRHSEADSQSISMNSLAGTSALGTPF